MPGKMEIIALEEHYLDPELKRHFSGLDETRQPEVVARLDDVGALRLKEMDEAGIDIQVLSHASPSLQKLDAESATRLARGVNDRLAETVRAHPDRFAAFAALPTPDPGAAADELERAVTKLGFKGAMVHGLTGGLFLDDKRFWPIFERAEALDVPLYLHPAVPHPAVIEAYYKDYIERYPMILRAAWGFTVETATQGIRLILSASSTAIRASRSSSAIWAKACRSISGASRWPWAAPATRPCRRKGRPSAIISASIFTSRQAASFPIRRCCAA
jgi:hypothetical protein